ncbi:MAG: hypothetical protein R3219_02905 [Hydrogenovibrio sp.]|nr:hypothetical protein [Hydrogenovibrio sp.]
MKKIIQVLVLTLAALGFASQAMAQKFKVGDTILVGFPASNIKDDAYIIGVVRKITPKGDYQIAVRDYVQGHDYGVSCVPIAVDSQGQETGKSGWEIWGKDTKKLRTQDLQYIVPASNAIPLNYGQMHYIDRYNIYVTYSRWKSHAPVLSVDRLETAQHEAISADMPGINPAFDIAILDRESYYENNTGRPYMPNESVPHLNKLFDHIAKVLKNDPHLNKLWRAKKRDWKAINASMKTYFLVDAIDEAVKNATDCLMEDGIEDSDPKALASLKSKLKSLGVKVH